MRPRILAVPFLIPFAALAQTWGPLILVKRGFERDPYVIAHELVHFHRQWGRLGMFFPLLYVWAWARSGFNYWRNEFEVEAFDLERHPYYLEWAKELIGT